MDSEKPSPASKQPYEPPRLKRVLAAGKRERTPAGDFYWWIAVSGAQAITEELQAQQDGGR